jgi:Ser/Thr protein kinase RdoA (MazF antagonist)
MSNLITFYQKRLNLYGAVFSLIEHDDAIVATVYKIIRPNGEQLILKICEHHNHYLREVYFLRYFAGKIPVPRIIQVVEPESSSHGAILMECLPGTLLKKTDLTDTLAYEIGSLLARIHLAHTVGYGDLIQPENLSHDPRVHFTQKFEEGLGECAKHLPPPLIDQCHSYYHTHLSLLDSVDGPCIIHRDFRPGNLIINQGKLQGIIDWSSARSGFAQEDFCSLEQGEWHASSTSRKSILSGYASIRPVPDYAAMMPLLQLSRAIAIIGFTVKNRTWESSNSRLYGVNRRFLETFF